MKEVAQRFGWKPEDCEQHLDYDTIVYPGHLVTPRNHNIEFHPDAFARHRIYGSWRKRKFGRRLELKMKHLWSVWKYYISHLGKTSTLPPVNNSRYEL